MTTTLDQFGRIVIPKALRKDFGLVQGTKLKIETLDAGLLIRCINQNPFKRTKEGLLIYTGEIEKNTGDLTKKLRDERIQYLIKGEDEMSF